MSETVRLIMGGLAIGMVFALLLARHRLCGAMRAAFWFVAFGLGSLYYGQVAGGWLGLAGCLASCIVALILKQHRESDEKSHQARTANP